MSNKKSILIMHVVYNFGQGGLENGIVNLINHLPQSEFRHVIVSLKDNNDFGARIKKEVKIIGLNKTDGNDLSVFVKAFKLYRELKPDVVHSRNLAAFEMQVPALLACIPYRIHGEHGRDVSDLDGRNVKYKILKKILTMFVHRVVAVSSELENYLLEEINVSKRKLVKIENGVNIELFSPMNENNSLIRGSVINDCDRFVIGTVGRLEEVKSQETLILGLKCLLNNRPDLKDKIKVVIVGDGSMKNHLTDLVHKNGLENNVSMPGSSDEIHVVMNSFDVFALTSKAEGMSNTILEAMSCGCPVIATNVGSNGVLISHGEDGYIIDVGDSNALAKYIEHYYENKKLLEKHSVMARNKIIDKYSIEIMVANYQQLYKRAIN